MKQQSTTHQHEAYSIIIVRIIADREKIRRDDNQPVKNGMITPAPTIRMGTNGSD
jgi:hypothetical protein